MVVLAFYFEIIYPTYKPFWCLIAFGPKLIDYFFLFTFSEDTVVLVQNHLDYISAAGVDINVVDIKELVFHGGKEVSELAKELVCARQWVIELFIFLPSLGFGLLVILPRLAV